MFSKRQIQLLRYLWEAYDYISLEMLSEVFGVTFRTIRNDVEELNEALKSRGATVIKKVGVGYKIQITDQKAFEEFKDHINQTYESGVIIPHYNIEVVDRIVRKLLFDENGVRKQELQKEMLLSDDAITKSINTAKDVLNKYHLGITSLPYHGLIVKGEERHLRLAMSDFLFEDTNGWENETAVKKNNVELDRIKRVTERACAEYNYRISFHSVIDLSKLIYISCKRYREYPVSIKTNNVFIEESQIEKEIARSIYTNLDFDMSETEQNYLALCVRSRKSYSLRDEFDDTIYNRYLSICDSMLTELDKYTGINFLNDRDLRKLISFELRSMVVRLSEGYEYKSISTLRMKTVMPTYNYAVIAMRKLIEENRWYINDSEISILAIIFHRSISKYNINYRKQRIGLVFNDGFISSRILYNLLKNNFDRYIDTVDAEEFISYRPEENKYDIIMSDMPKSYFSHDYHPFYQYMNVFNDRTKREIKNLLTDRTGEVDEFITSIRCFHKDVLCKDKEAFLNKYVKTLDFPDNSWKIHQSILEREQFSSCENNYGIVVCQTMYPMIENTTIDVYTLKKKILWEEEYVKLIFIICNGYNEKYPFMSQNLINLIFKKPEAIYDVLISHTIQDIKEAIHKAIL